MFDNNEKQWLTTYAIWSRGGLHNTALRYLKAMLGVTVVGWILFYLICVTAWAWLLVAAIVIGYGPMLTWANRRAGEKILNDLAAQAQSEAHKPTLED